MGINAEIQIRTTKMHLDNENGVTAHHTYKVDKTNEPRVSFDWLSQLGTLKDQELSPDEYIHELRSDFFETRIFALTPDGDVVDLPIGATALDFAYSVHTDIGDHAVEALIDGVARSIFTPIESESVVEVVTAPGATPVKEWLKHVTTSHARNKINKALLGDEGRTRY